VLAAVAQATTRIRLGTAVSALPRRRPVVLANAVATLDRLSNGRVILGAGLGGVPREFTAFGESDDPRQRADMLDESLELIAALWTGEPVTHHGRHYRVDGVRLAPPPVQRPRVPIWIGGGSRAARRRATRWDGWIIGGDDEHGTMVMTPAQAATDLADLQSRHDDRNFDIVLTGAADGPDAAAVHGFADVGFTWWLEHIHSRRGSFSQLLGRVNAGPPSAS
jgi:alkanesulfonate monooxygenase SsuD/methylene tetrahydromethanopterin reductase-like flavin-dependent oxidoreductase (luciferase family)